MGTDSILENRKHYQRNKMLNIIRSNTDISRNDVKKISAYSMTTVLGAINEMVSEGLVIEEQCEDARVGRKPTWLRINPDGGYFIGVGFNRNQLHCVTLDFAGEPVFVQETDIDREHKNAEAVIGLIKQKIRQALDYLGKKNQRVIGIGLGVPGYSDLQAGVAISYNHLNGWENIPLKNIVEEAFGIPCYMDNNVNVMIYAYKWLVYHGQCEDMLFVSVRTGARVMPIINNQPVSSSGGFPGELGHIRIRGGSRLCSCGRYGCLNSEISDVAIVNKIMDGIRVGRFQEISEMVHGDMEQITMSVFVESVRRNHEDSVRLEKQITKYLGETLGMLCNIFAPKKIVLYGELLGIGEMFLEDIRSRVKKDTIKENCDGLEIVASQFGRDLSAMGAASLVLQEAFPFAEEMI